MQTQLIGINFFDRSINIYETIINFQTQLNNISKENKANLEASLGTNGSIFSTIAQDLRHYMKSNETGNLSAYLKQLDDIENKIQANITTIEHDGLNEGLNDQELRDLLTTLKDNMLSFLDLIIDIFNLQLYTNKTTGLQIDMLINRLPSYQDELSQLLSQPVSVYSQDPS